MVFKDMHAKRSIIKYAKVSGRELMRRDNGGLGLANAGEMDEEGEEGRMCRVGKKE